jgi:hypothetical protein
MRVAGKACGVPVVVVTQSEATVTRRDVVTVATRTEVTVIVVLVVVTAAASVVRTAMIDSKVVIVTTRAVIDLVTVVIVVSVVVRVAAAVPIVTVITFSVSVAARERAVVSDDSLPAIVRIVVPRPREAPLTPTICGEDAVVMMIISSSNSRPSHLKTKIISRAEPPGRQPARNLIFYSFFFKFNQHHL